MPLNLTDRICDLIIFGGAFDPPHAGHLELLRAAKTHLPEARIVVVPTLDPPGLPNDRKIAKASYEQRLSMAELMFSKLGVEVSRVEAYLETPSYTWQTLEVLRETFADARIHLLVGEDQLASISRWQKPRFILRTAQLLIAQRAGTNSSLIQKTAEAVASLGVHVTPAADERSFVLSVRHRAIGSVSWLRTTEHPASSREARSDLARGSMKSSWLPESLAVYIKNHQLYREESRS